jgi:erythronate-4-phosphate dehydrogenase
MKIVADANIPFVKEAFDSVGNVTTVIGRQITPEQVRDADILLVRSVTHVDADLLRHSKVKFVGTATIGIDHVDLQYLQREHIGFANAPGSNAISAAEYVVSSILYLTQSQEFRLAGKTVGIIGCGNVGSNVLSRLQALGVSCVVYDPPRASQFNDRDYATWEEVIQADIITAHVPLTFSGDYPTYQMFDLDFFRQLKTDAVFINTARGRAVNEAALLSVLPDRPDLQLVLDVWQSEPNINLELLNSCKIATPHIAGYSLDGKVRGTEMVYQAVCEFFKLQPVWSMPVLPFANTYTAMQFNDDIGDDEVIRQSVFNAYNVMDDAARLREITEIAPDQRGNYFDNLRKNYPVRREFSNYEVIISQAREPLLNALTGLGFRVETAVRQLTR